MDNGEMVNKLLVNADPEQLEVIKDGYHFIRSLITNYAKKKDLISINYKTDLKSGVRLDPIHYFTNDGLLKKTIYNYDSKPVLVVYEEYQYNSDDEANTTMPISKRGIHGRTKTWRYYFEDGTLDETNKEGTYKEKSKIYKTDREGLVVGGKRRKNIQIILSGRAGLLLVIMGVYTNVKDVKDQMRNVSAKYSSSFQEFEKYGTENIFTDIENDNEFSWFNTYIPTDVDMTNLVTAGQMSATQQGMLKGAFQHYELTNIQGLTVRQYFLEKLKGNIK